MFQALLEKRAAHRARNLAYKRTVDGCLEVLFRGFPDGLRPSLGLRLSDAGLVRQGLAEGTDPRTCSVQVAVLHIRRIIGRLSQRERQDLALAFLRNDGSNRTYKGFKYMFRVLEQLNVSPALVSYLKSEIAGQLGGMSQQAIFNSWVEAQIGGVMNRLREQCLEEAKLKRDIWQ
jgi:hypothetical protein